MKYINSRLIKPATLVALVAAFSAGNQAYGQAAESTSSQGLNIDPAQLPMYIAVAVLAVAVVVALIGCIYALYALNLIIHKEKVKAGKAASKEGVFSHLWKELNRKFGAGEVLPVNREEEIMMDHAYDGISELNNHMPPWLKYIFYITIAFAVVYVSNYLIFHTGKSQIEEYQDELAQAEQQAQERKLVAGDAGPVIDETNVELLTDAAALDEAKAIFMSNCSPCHRKDAGGAVGPNLTDEYWLHGGDVKDIFKVIKYGVQEKGMIPWQDILKPEEIQKVASYVLSLQGSSPADPKAPQGEKYVRKETEQAAAMSSSL